MIGLLGFVTGPIGRYLVAALVISAAIAGAYLRGRVDQRHANDQAHAAEVAQLAAANLAREQQAAKVAADVAQAHGAAVQAVQADNDALKRRIAAAPLTVRLVPVPGTPEASASPPGDPHAAAPSCPAVVDVDALRLGPDVLRLWNDAYGGAGPVVPGAGRAPGAVPSPDPVERRPEWLRRAARDPDETRRRYGGGEDLRGPG